MDGRRTVRPNAAASNVTALSDALEAIGLVERRLDPLDRRIKTQLLRLLSKVFRPGS